MTDKELRKLKRSELLELMYYMKKELDEVKEENEALRSQLNAHVAGQADINKEILEAVLKTAKKVDALCKAENLEVSEEDEPLVSGDSEVEENISEDAKETEQ